MRQVVGLAVVCVASLWGSTALAAPVPYVDASGEVSISYTFDRDAVVFTAQLPANNTFFVRVDGDEDGQWGDGPKSPETITAHPTRDWQISYDPRDGSFCAQYILAARQHDPSRVLASAVCGSFISGGTAEIQNGRRTGWVQMSYRVPMRKLFGISPDAHLQFCVSDGHQTACQHTPTAPFILRRPPVPAT